MTSTPNNSRTSIFSANTGLGLNSKLTPLNTPFQRGPRSPYKTRSPYESGLSLKRVIGTTVSSPTAFDTLPTEPIFAYTAGAATVVVNIDDASNITQRFFRARPTAVALQSVSNFPGTPSTPTNVANDGRNRTLAGLRDTGIPYSPSSPHSGLEYFAADSPSGKSGAARGRIKAATCLSISRDGKLLAVGETGVEPRVLIFSLQNGSSDIPLAILNGHCFGVSAIAFSPDGKYLASLGLPQDGFLYVWSINQRTGAAKLHSSGKCITNIRQMLWLRNSVITIGTRHIKVWRIEEPRSSSPTKPRFNLDGTPQPTPTSSAGMIRTLAGRNVVLGPLLEMTFTTIAVISDAKAIICSDRGDVCLLDDAEATTIVKVASTGFSIACTAVDTQERLVRIGGSNGRFKTLNLDQLLAPTSPPESPIAFDEDGVTSDNGHLLAMGYACRNLVTINSKQLIEISNATSDIVGPPVPTCTPFPAHGDAVLGVRLLSQPNEMQSSFITWSADGLVVFWDLEGNCKATLKTTLEQAASQEDISNQCLVVRASVGVKFLVTGDKFGVLRVIDVSSQLTTFEARAHSSDILDIALHEDDDGVMLATCGRDKTVQLFRLISGQWTLMQTLNDHSASVSTLLFTQNGEKLISCSANRDILVRQIVKREGLDPHEVAAIPFKIISLKSAPKSMTICVGDQAGNLLVAMADRSVGTYEIASGRLVSSFRATDSEGTDNVVLGALSMGAPSIIPGHPTILAGLSESDKSVRIYNGVTGAFLDKEWGHTAGVEDVVLLESPDTDQKTLVSTGSDGTIMIWQLSANPSDSLESQDMSTISGDASTPKDTPVARPPLRRVLSRAEMAEFQRASPSSTPTGNRSPPRVLRRKTSRYGGLSSQTPALAPPPVTLGSSKHFASSSDETAVRRAGRNRSRSPPSPKVKDMRRPSLANLNDSKGRVRGTGNFSEYGTLNMSTESACRTLRSYRKKLLSSEPVKDELLRELDQELRLTVIALGERSLKSKTMNEEVLMRGLLDQYSERLVSMFDEKLRMSKVEANNVTEEEEPEPERPKTAGNPTIASPV